MNHCTTVYTNKLERYCSGLVEVTVKRKRKGKMLLSAVSKSINEERESEKRRKERERERKERDRVTALKVERWGAYIQGILRKTQCHRQSCGPFRSILI